MSDGLAFFRACPASIPAGLLFVFSSLITLVRKSSEKRLASAMHPINCAISPPSFGAGNGAWSCIPE